MTKPRLLVLTTGGTILSVGASASQLDGYSLEGLNASALMEAFPDLAERLEFTFETPCYTDSASMKTAYWRAILTDVEKGLADPAVRGIVILHGTDTLEETAFLLSVLTRPEKPVVITGSMRPASAVSADGPMNLREAILLASDPNAPKGVSVVVDDTVFEGTRITKSHPTHVHAFSAPVGGPAGEFVAGRFHALMEPTRRQGALVRFAKAWLETDHVPFIPVVTSHTDDSTRVIDALLAAGAEGIVYAGTGNGSVHEDAEPALERAHAAGVPVVRASRVSAGSVSEGSPAGVRLGMITARLLTAWQARTLLSILIAAGAGKEDIEEVFRTI